MEENSHALEGMTALPAHDASGMGIGTDIAFLHVDDALIVVRKPAGLLSVPGRGPQHADCVAARVQGRYPEALIVHRLDMATSGLLVMARNADAHRRLSRAFADRLVDKRYVAVVAGRMTGDHGEVALPLICDWPNRPRQMVDHARGKPSLTRWQVLSRDTAAGTTRVALEPVTGRSHQLRVHLLALGHPIVGDELYAPPLWQQAAPRLLLHACRLSLPHPDDDRVLTLEDEVPF
jgi:tRNA pseudouridine32 synthase/23S rRNA pseudouridine746 synthase